jgi:hypothetical protein
MRIARLSTNYPNPEAMEASNQSFCCNTPLLSRIRNEKGKRGYLDNVYNCSAEKKSLFRGKCRHFLLQAQNPKIGGVDQKKFRCTVMRSDDL